MFHNDENSVNKELFHRLMISEERYQNVMNAATDSIFINNLNGSFLEANEAACKALGYTYKEITSMSVWDIEVGFSKEKITNIASKLLDGPFNIEGRHRRKNGTTFPVDVRMSAFKAAGETLILAIVRDISQQKNTELTIKRLSYTLDNIPSLVIITDIEGKIEYVNSKVLKQTDFYHHELIGQNFCFIHSGKGANKSNKLEWSQLIKDKAYHGELFIRNKHSAVFGVSATISPMFDDNKNFVTNYLIIMDPLFNHHK